MKNNSILRQNPKHFETNSSIKPSHPLFLISEFNNISHKMHDLSMVLTISTCKLHSISNDDMRISSSNSYNFGDQTTNSDLIATDLAFLFISETRFHCFIDREIYHRMDQSNIWNQQSFEQSIFNSFFLVDQFQSL